MDVKSRYSEIPQRLKNPQDGCTYKRERLLGKGAFAVCFQYSNTETRQLVAVKVIVKDLASKKDQMSKVMQEIRIHTPLNHKHVVKFYGFFEDAKNIYVFLELCDNFTLMELSARRKTVTLFECRFLMRQLVGAILYLHENNVIHRDLKLGNVFIDGCMHVKLGDFGLAAVIDNMHTKRRTFCGTPNYLAPEVLDKRGHNIEVDAWSLGCIIYTLLVGKPPFETSSVKVTYSKISKNEFTVPLLDSDAKDLIVGLLQPKPERRYTMEEVLAHRFFNGYCPRSLPVSCLSTEPRVAGDVESAKRGRNQLSDNFPSPASALSRYEKINPPQNSCELNRSLSVSNALIVHLFNLLRETVDSCSKFPPLVNDEQTENPALSPLHFIARWRDTLDTSLCPGGLSYELSDGSSGILFSDFTRLLLHPDDKTIQYIDRNGCEKYFNKNYIPEQLTSKLRMFEASIRYMESRLVRTGLKVSSKDKSGLRRLPYLVKWMGGLDNLVLFQLSNGLIQVNFLDDHYKFVLCPTMQSVTYVGRGGDSHTLDMTQIGQIGCTADVKVHLDRISAVFERFCQLSI